MKPAAVLLRRAGLAGLVLVLLGAFGWVLARTGPLAPIRVTTAQVEEGALAPELFGIGSVEARRSYLIGPTVAGRVLRVVVDVGDTVTAGQLLAEMDPVDLDERTAALDASVARAGSVAAGAEAQLRDARARRELATINARRYVELGASHFVSASVVEAKEQEQVSAQAGLQAADAGLAAARQDITRLRSERDGLAGQRRKLRLLAPAAGVVTARDAEPGSTVIAGQAVLRLIEPASLWLRVRIDQGRSSGLALGLPAQIVLRSNPGQAVPGKVVRVELVSDSVTEERAALVAFEAIPAGVSVGELAEVTLTQPAGPSGLLLPGASIKRQGGTTGVWLLDADGPRFVPVQIGSAGLDGRVRVSRGIKAGDRVIVHSEREIAAGSRIRVVESLPGAGS
ncbi:efflux RND transporter periplasmic adaptor subunit [Zoogloea sp.]|uniref:efflux RND transporter periplasmic adaptor subunit n=1 Tax=Zoogloea sp. TaxID=49181 RepID=UPI0026077EAD|nr:efflux RND transporter periplasmic adaptor subunit [Zoogloea sp.]